MLKKRKTLRQFGEMLKSLESDVLSKRKNLSGIGLARMIRVCRGQVNSISAMIRRMPADATDLGD